MAEPYAFPDLDALQQMLAEQNAAGGELAALKMQQAQANALRGSRHAAGGPAGYSSPLGAARDAFKSYQGEMLGQQVQDQVADVAGRAQAAEGMQGITSLRQARAQAEQSRGDRLTQQEQARTDRLAKDATAGWTEVSLENEQGDRKLALRKGDQVVDYHTKEPIGPGWFPREREYAGSTGVGGRGGVVANRDIVKSLTLVSRANDLGAAADALPPSDVEALNASGDVFKRLLIGAVTPAAFKTFIQQRGSSLSPEGQRFLMKLNSMSAEERHRLFGAALTGREEASAEEFMVAAKGLTLDEILNRLHGFTEKARPQFQSADDVYNTTYTPLFDERNTYFGPEGGYLRRGGGVATPTGAAPDAADIDTIDDPAVLERILAEERARAARAGP